MNKKINQPIKFLKNEDVHQCYKNQYDKCQISWVSN